MPHKEIKKPLPKKETHPQPRHVPPPPRYVPPPPPAQEEPKKGLFGRIKSKFS